jgi:CDP-diacylglycerol--serine O-phosphatidyltransferase
MKQMRIPRALTLPALILAALFVAALVTLPWATLLAIGALYLASIPLSVIVQRRATTSGPSDMAS